MMLQVQVTVPYLNILRVHIVKVEISGHYVNVEFLVYFMYGSQLQFSDGSCPFFNPGFQVDRMHDHLPNLAVI